MWKRDFKLYSGGVTDSANGSSINSAGMAVIG